MRTLDAIEELRVALVEFARRYNETWLVARQPKCEPTNVGLIKQWNHRGLGFLCAHAAATCKYVTE